MADWSQLPSEILELILKRLPTSYDVIRFRSVCSTWRYTVTSPNLNLLVLRILDLPRNGPGEISYSDFTLSKRAIYLIEPPKTSTRTNNSTPWLFKIEENDNVPNNRVSLMEPLSNSHFDSLPGNIPKALNLMDFRVSELGFQYVLRFLYNDDNLHVKKTCKALLSCLDNDVNKFVLLAILDSGSLSMFKSSDKRWTSIQGYGSFCEDVILFKGNFYAINLCGRTSVVGLDSEINVVCDSWTHFSVGQKKFLVESKGELLCVKMSMRSTVEDEEEGFIFSQKYFDNIGFYMDERGFGFKVFKFDEVAKVWFEDFSSLADRVLFLGDDFSFSASPEELSLCRGNYIIYSGNLFLALGGDDASSHCYVGVYDFETCSGGPIRNYPQISQLFCAPPNWISSSTTLDGDRHTQTDHERCDSGANPECSIEEANYKERKCSSKGFLKFYMRRRKFVSRRHG